MNLRRFIRQQTRRAEGRTRNFRRYFWDFIKLDFIFVSCVSFMSLLFIIGQSAALFKVVLVSSAITQLLKQLTREDLLPISLRSS